jgi:hypothetical protein
MIFRRVSSPSDTAPPPTDAAIIFFTTLMPLSSRFHCFFGFLSPPLLLIALSSFEIFHYFIFADTSPLRRRAAGASFSPQDTRFFDVSPPFSSIFRYACHDILLPAAAAIMP